MVQRIIGGIFVGGASRRMGGRPKGLLPAPDGGEPLVLRAVRLVREVSAVPVLVGDAAAYRAALPELAGPLGVEELADDPPGIGPLGGLCALLSRAAPGERVIAIACDMPYVGADDLRALIADPSTADVCAARRDDDAPWEPLLARYDAARVLPVARAAIAAGERGLQRLFARLHVSRFVPSSPRAMDDWDEPDDVKRA
ncbi:MAG: NTP transferase domain-containing protein [Deltaproteobacteria bacterium]|nr:NTP transferase domain-containing protein [Deltaproteobacteria bacterium]